MIYHEHFFSNLTKIYDDMETSHPDVTLLCIEDGAKLKCHRIVLCAASDYFKNVFHWNLSDILEIHNGITSEIMELILRFIYSGKLSISLQNVSEVLLAVNYLSIPVAIDLCVDFIFDNLDQHNCLDMLLFSSQLGLTKLHNGVSPFVLKSFSQVLGEPYLKEQLMSLPLNVMVEMLKSNDLVLVDEISKLPTRPVQREKLILDFIFEYSEGLLTDEKDIDITRLLSCVKWPLLQMSKDENYVHEFAGKFVSGKYTVEILELFGGHRTDTSVEDRCEVRSYSSSELVMLPPLANLGDLRGSLRSFNLVCGPNEYIRQIDIVTRMYGTWVGNRIIVVVGGITIHFTNGQESRCQHAGIPDSDGVDVYNVKLRDGEHITQVNAKAGTQIDSLTFNTSNDRTLGPFGNPDGGSRKLLMDTVTAYREEVVARYQGDVGYTPGPHERVSLLDSFLVGVTGSEVVARGQGQGQGHLSLTGVSFVFREMIPTKSRRISSTEECESTLLNYIGHTSRSDNSLVDIFLKKINF